MTALSSAPATERSYASRGRSLCGLQVHLAQALPPQHAAGRLQEPALVVVLAEQCGPGGQWCGLSVSHPPVKHVQCDEQQQPCPGASDMRVVTVS